MSRSTKDLTDELLQREGITQIKINPYEIVKIITDQGEREFTGPAIIMVNQD